MYLAKVKHQRKIHYIIRQSFFDKQQNGYRYREIFDLGENPADHIELFDERICFFAEALEDAVAEGTQKDPTLLLEHLLWNYLPRDIRERLSLLGGREKITIRPLTNDDREAIAREIHLFDRKRLYFLRYNAIDQSRLYRMHEKLCRPLLGQCRDEREYYFQEQEAVLQPTEYKSYVYAIFNLQRHFHKFFSTFMPEALDQDEITDHLEKDICTLNQDRNFWNHMDPPVFLHEHLQRYLVMFFDYDYPRRSFAEDFARQFQNSHRKFRWPDRKTVTREETSSIFGEDFKKLKEMNKQELTRLFRKKAKEFHPDKGGENEKFITLCNAYNDLLSHKK